jgi:hypothetical protein
MKLLTDSSTPSKRPTSSTPWQYLLLLLRGATLRTALPAALVVGTILALINQSSIIVRGHATTGTWVSAALDYCVPFLVSSYGYLAASQKRT